MVSAKEGKFRFRTRTHFTGSKSTGRPLAVKAGGHPGIRIGCDIALRCSTGLNPPKGGDKAHMDGKKKYSEAIRSSLQEIPHLDQIPRMDYQQFRQARALTKKCCNNYHDNCLLLDDGDPCPCVQAISYSVICKYFRACVLPEDEHLFAQVLHLEVAKKCARCGKQFIPAGANAKYCRDCSRIVKRERTAARVRKYRSK